MASLPSALTLLHLLYGVILGVTQGISEWLPISSKTQVIVVSTYLLNLPFNQAYTFGLFMEAGTVLAAIVYFRRELWSLVRFIIRRGDAESKALFKYVVVSTIATAIIATPIYLAIDSITGSYNLGIPMLILGAVLIIDALLIRYAKARHRHMSNRKRLQGMTLKDFALVGIAQGIAALPGISRSGITTSSLLLLNVDADESFRLSFLASIFATSGAVGLTLVASKSNVSSVVGIIGLPGLAVAIIVSFAISIFLIRFLLRTAAHSRIVYFVAALGIIAIASGIIAGITNVG